MTMDAREAGFFERLAAGEDVESGDWMPDAYRQQVLRFIEMHGNSELMGALPERDWIVRAPTLQRKLALTAKIREVFATKPAEFDPRNYLGPGREAVIGMVRRKLKDDVLNSAGKAEAVVKQWEKEGSPMPTFYKN